MWSTFSLALLSSQLLTRVIASDRVLSMDQMEETMWKQMTDVKL